MNKIIKRAAAIVTALAVMLTAVVFDIPEKLTAKAAQSSSAGGCNGDHSGMTKLTSSTVLPSKSSGDYYYYLDEDITLDTLLDIDPPANGFSYDINVTLCLNGHTLTAASKMRILYICSATFTLCDCEGSGHPGKMTGGNTTGISGGGAVYVGNSTGKKGGTFIMNGGTITGNNTTRTGGGVMVNDRTSTFIMNGGTISNNDAAGNGGGVYTDCGTIIINGGTISGNTSSMGGGIYCYDSTLNGGTITGNKADTGGGIYFMGDMTLNGNVTITGNTKTDGTTLNNLYIESDRTITIGNDFSNASKVGVTTVNTPEDCTGYVEVTGTTSKDVSSSFTADNDKLSIVYKNSKVQLTGAHSYSTTWGKDANNHWHTCSKCGGKDSAAHTWNSGTVTTNATCTSTGVKTYTCTVCSQTKTETIPATGHSTTHTAANAATCTEDGNKEYWYCSKCKKYFSNSTCTTEITNTVIAKLNHSFSSDWETDGTNHWHVCTRTDCTAVSGEAAHSFEQKKDGDNHWDECSVCGYKTNITAHNYTAPKRDENDHWQECGCGAKKDITAHSFVDKSDDTCFWQECSCGYIIGKTEHSNFTQKYDDDNHWYECDVCQHKKNIEEHSFAQQHDGDNHWLECGCGYKKDEAAHEWGDWALTVEPTVDATGTAERTCSCGEKQIKTDVPVLTDDAVWTKDETTKPTIDTDGEYTYESDYGTVTEEVPKLSYTEIWTKDTENSIAPTEEQPGKDVYTSAYGTVTVTIPPLDHTHTLVYVPEVPATETEEGVREHWHCDGCGKDFIDENGEIEATGDELKIGKLEKEVQSGENAPTATLTTPNEELANAVLTEEEQAVINDGKDIKIVLKIDVQDEPAAEDKTAVETAIGDLTDYNLGMYLDVNLFKVINGEENPITETNVALTITFEVPEGLRGSARAYSVIRVHDGETTVLEDKDNDPDTVTIETDKFSTYALAYSENKNDTPPDESNSGSTNIPSLGEPTNSGYIPSESSGASDTDTTQPSDENSSTDDSGINSSDGTTSSDENNSSPSESASAPDNSGNPSTGIAVSLVPLAAAAITALMVTVKRKKK